LNYGNDNSCSISCTGFLFNLNSVTDIGIRT
jgi:hypothetical protein